MPDRPKSPQQRNIQLFLIIGFLFALFYIYSKQVSQSDAKSIDYDTFMTKVEAGEFQVLGANENDRSMVGKTKDTVYVTHYTGDVDIGKELRAHLPERKHIPIEIRARDNGNSLGSIFMSLLPMLVIVVIFLLFMRQLGSAQGGAQKFAKSKAKLITQNSVKVGLSDVILDQEVKESVGDLIDYLKDAKKFRRLGGKMPKGALFIGPPGCGKTLLARALAGEAGIPFFATSGSDFVEMFVGVGAGRVRDMFEQANKNQPCILFIDEIDGVGRHRGAGLGGGHDEREQTLNQLLVEMDGLEERGHVFIIAATNRPDVLDPALLRRFPRTVVVPLPDLVAREAIARKHAETRVMAPNVSFADFAKLTSGQSGDDIENIVNEAAVAAGKDGSAGVTEAHLLDAFDKKLMGVKRSLKQSEEDRRETAFHEAGHTIIRLNHPGRMAFHKVSIVPRGRALGVSMSLPDGDISGMSREDMWDSIMVCMGGRGAEILMFNKITTGASNDLMQATNLANDMCRRYGMDDDLGPVCYAANETEVFLGRDLGSRKGNSSETEREIELTVRALLKRMAKAVADELAEEKVKLTALAEALLDRETLTAEQVMALPEFANG